MNTKIKILFGSVLLAFIGYKMYGWCISEFWCQVENGFPFDAAWFLYGGIIGVLVASANFFSGSLELDEGSFLRDVVFAKGDGNPVFDEASDRAWYNSHQKGIYWWAGSDTYIDYDGYTRKITDDELVNNVCNGKQR